MGVVTKAALLVAAIVGCLLLSANVDALLALVGGADNPALRKGSGQLFLVGAWLAGALLVNLVIRVTLWEGVVGRALGHAVPVLLTQLSAAVVLFVATLLIVHQVFEASILGFLTALGAVSVVIAFGLRGLVSDLFTGLAINVEQPFQIGDWIAFYDTQGGQHEGQVVQINWRTTHLVAENHNYLVIPNREIGDSTVINYWKPKRANRFELRLTLDYAVAVDEARRILLAAVSAVLDSPGFDSGPKPQVLVDKLDEDGVKYLVRYWITPWDGTSPSLSRDVVQTSIMKHLRLAGVTPAYAKLEHFQQPKPEVLTAGTSAHLPIRQMLGLMDFFSPLNDQELDQVVNKGETASWPAGDTLLTEGDEGASMFVVLQGLLDVWLHPDGQQAIRVGQIEAGEFFGEMSLLTGEPRGATIRAATPVLTLEITKPVMQQLLTDRPVLMERISELVARRQQATRQAKDQQINELATTDDGNGAAQLIQKIRAFFGQS
ncbi:MAG: mechanosensitive ion channel family protein [Pseudomonadota bacterium]